MYLFFIYYNLLIFTLNVKENIIKQRKSQKFNLFLELSQRSLLIMNSINFLNLYFPNGH